MGRRAVAIPSQWNETALIKKHVEVGFIEPLQVFRRAYVGPRFQASRRLLMAGVGCGQINDGSWPRDGKDR